MASIFIVWLAALKGHSHGERCLTAARTQGNREHIARAMGVMGILFAEEGHLDSALHHLEQEASWFV